jgi:chromosome segregation ATPase
MAELSPQRAALAAALARVADVEAFGDRARSALAAVQVKLSAAGRDFQDAEAALQEAQQGSNEPTAALRRAMGDAQAQPTVTELQHSLDAKRAAFNEVQRDRDLCRRAIEQLEHDDDRAQYASREAAGALLAASPGVAGLLSELHAARRHCVTLEAALTEIAKVPGALRPYWRGLRREDELPDLELAARWREIIAKLITDGDTPLPGGDPEPQPAAEAA